jgi:hypothetical protein
MCNIIGDGIGVGVHVKLVVEGEEQDGQGVLVQQQASSRTLTIDSTEAAAARPKHGMILPFHRLTISFKNIKYFVDMPAVLNLLMTFFVVFGIGCCFCKLGMIQIVAIEIFESQ